MDASLQSDIVTELPPNASAPGDAALSGETTAAPVAGKAPDGVAHPKTIKSFVRRAGRTTTGQAKAFEDLGPRFIVPYAPAPLDAVAASDVLNNGADNDRYDHHQKHRPRQHGQVAEAAKGHAHRNRQRREGEGEVADGVDVVGQHRNQAMAAIAFNLFDRCRQHFLAQLFAQGGEIAANALGMPLVGVDQEDAAAARFIPLRDLLEGRGPGIDRHVNLYYLHYWGLTHFLFHYENGKYAAAYKQLLARGASTPDFERLIGPIGEIEEVWYAYMLDAIATMQTYEADNGIER